MENDENKGVLEVGEFTEAAWQQVNHNGQIKFTKKKRASRIKGVFKGLAFLLVAAMSGGATATYLVNKRLENVNTSYNNTNNQSLLEQKSSVIQTSDLPKNNITRVAETVGPTVVGISNKGESFLGEVNQGSGSGIIFDKRGYIVTNYHVIEGADKVFVKLANGNTLPATFVGVNQSRDLAVIKIDAQNLPVARFGDSSKIKVGDVAIAIGNPLGDQFAGSVTAGIISAVNRKIEMPDEHTGKTTTYNVLQTDAAINPGNSGGALCNEAGEIIGINSLKIGSKYNAEGMGFAITINEAKDIIDKIMKSGKDSTDTSQNAPNAVLGIMGGTAVPEENSGVKGVYIEEVTQGMGAEAAGVKPTDIIVEADKTKIETMEQLQDILRKHKPGDGLKCRLWRDGSYIQVTIILSERKAE